MGGAHPTRGRARSPTSLFGRSAAHPPGSGRCGRLGRSVPRDQDASVRPASIGEGRPRDPGRQVSARARNRRTIRPVITIISFGGSVRGAAVRAWAPTATAHTEGDDDGRQSPDRGEDRNNARRSTGPKVPLPLPIQRPQARPLRACGSGCPARTPPRSRPEFDGWRRQLATPDPHPRFVLVDLAAVATWRLRRSIRARVRRPLPPRRRRRTRPDSDRHAAVERRALDRFDDDPGARPLPARVHRPRHRPPPDLLGQAGRLPGGRAGRLGPAVPPALDDPAEPPHGTPCSPPGRVPIASARLLASRRPGMALHPRGRRRRRWRGGARTAAEAMARLREQQGRPRPGSGPSPRPMEAATADTSHKLRLLPWYEMDHERSLRWAAPAG